MKTTKANFMKLFLPLCAALLSIFGHIEAQDSTYYFTTFGTDQDQKLYVYSSTDGANFSLFENNGFGGPTGVLRDPALFYYNSKYYIAFTVQSWTTSSTTFAIASSSDLISWTTIATVPCGVPGTYFTWAPDWFVDNGTIKLIVSLGSSSSGPFKPYLYTALDNTLTSWSGPVDMGLGTNHIDSYVIKSGNTFHCFTKNETSKNIEHYIAASLTGPWALAHTLWNGYEGVCVIQQGSTWRIYIDHYSAGDGLYTATSSDLNTWSTLTKLNFGRHGACLKTVTSSGHPVTGISISPISDTVNINEEIQLTPVISPANATIKKVIWSSSKSNIATVDSTGKVTGKAIGSTLIIAQTVDMKKIGSSTVVVIIPVTGISISPISDTININEKIQLTAVISPTNATIKKVVWNSSNSDIATVDTTGKVTGKAIGSTLITAQTVDMKKIASSTVVVIIAPTPTSTKGKILNNISIYPNPLHGKQLTVNGLSGVTTIRLVDINGRVIQSQQVNNQQLIQLNVNLKSDVYFLEVICTLGTIRRKVVVD